jgi:hypothetical protein
MWKLVQKTGRNAAVDLAVKRLSEALSARGVEWETAQWEGLSYDKAMYIGLRSDSAVASLAPSCPAEPESFCFADRGRLKVVAGSDARGLAYAIYELIERVGFYGEDALLNLGDSVHSPDVKIRGANRFISNSGDESWWLSEDFWREYLETLLSDRFNRLTLTVGFDTAYLSPPYAFIIETPGFEGVRLAGDAGYNRAAYLAALQMIGELCREYEITFCFSIWQQQPWQTEQDNLVIGLDDQDMLMEYCAAGVSELLRLVPGIDVLQYRVNHESGVGTQVSAEDYWLRQFDALARVKAGGRDIKLELRAKGMTDKMVTHARDAGLDVIVSTKYWCEHAGLPYHLTQMRAQEACRLQNLNHARRYSYADMLRKPRTFDFVYRLWANGSIDLFTWGDPDYARRFMHSLRLGPAAGYDVMVPLSYKGGHETHKHTGWKLFDGDGYQMDGWEDARYWLFYRLFGRIGYDNNACADQWMLTMRGKFGEAAEAAMAALTQASRFLPFLTAWHFPEHPQECYWPELMTGASLFPEHNYNPHFKRSGVTYQSSQPSDEGMFYSIDGYVRGKAAGTLDGRYTIYQSLKWTKDMISSAGAYLREAEAIGMPDTPEAKGLALDVRMIIALGEYHIEKALAALALSRKQILGEESRIHEAVRHLELAIDKWGELSKLGTGTYHSNLIFGVGANLPREGTWSDYLPELESDLDKLRVMASQRQTDSPNTVDESAFLIETARALSPAWSVDLPQSHSAGAPLDVYLRVPQTETAYGHMVMRVRHTNQLEGSFRSYAMKRAPGGWTAAIPAQEMDAQWDLLVFFESVDGAGNGMRFPGLWHSTEMLPYYIIRINP